MDPASILMAAEVALKAVQTAKALYAEAKDTLTSSDDAKVQAALNEIDAEASTLTTTTLARLDAASKT